MDKKRIAKAVKDYLARHRMSREQFAFRTKLGKSTVDKLLIGLFSERTLAIVEDYTKLELRPPAVDGASIEPDAAAVSAALSSKPRPLEGPSIAVLPFSNLGGHPEQDHIGDGMAEDILTALTRLRWLHVIARNSTFAYKSRAVDVRQIARELGVRYVLEGSVRATESRIRVSGQLIDAATGKHIWAERYDRDLKDLFSVQDELTTEVVAAVEPHLYAEEGLRLAARPTQSLDAWGLVVRALGLIAKVERQPNEEARELLERAIALEPHYARAHALLGWAKWWSTYCYWESDRERIYREALRHAQVALAHDATDPWARMVAGLCLSSAGEHERALVELTAALRLNPSFALGHLCLGWSLLRAGKFDDAIASTGRAARLSPVDTFSGFYVAIHGLSLLGAHRFEEALPHLRASVAAFEQYAGHYNSLISCCGHLGLLEEAREYIAKRNSVGPPICRSVLRENLSRFAHRDIFIEGLEKAGVPE